MLQATLERMEKKTLDTLTGKSIQSEVIAAMQFYRNGSRSVKELFEAAREAARMTAPTIHCGLCGREASVLSQEYYRSGRQVCAECFDAGWRDWMRQRRRARGR